MPTDILLKQLNSSLSELKSVIDKFEQHPSPSTQQAEELYSAIGNSNKLISAYLVLKEKKDVAPDLDLHIKLMAVPTPEEKKVVVDIEPDQELQPVEPEVQKVFESQISNQIPDVKSNVFAEPSVQVPPQKKEYPKLAISINDKFRFINELFRTNANEYNIAIEQLNTVNTWEDAKAYLSGLKDIYIWDEEHEMVKKLHSLTQKRFV